MKRKIEVRAIAGAGIPYGQGELLGHATTGSGAQRVATNNNVGDKFYLYDPVRRERVFVYPKTGEILTY